MSSYLPIGQQDFPDLISTDALYIDKTEYIRRLVTAGKYFFLARPRRFGKSLTVSTISTLFAGRRDLFKGLWVEDKWNWEETNPVIHLTFNSINYRDQSLDEAISQALREEAERYDLTLRGEVVSDQFRYLLADLHAARGKVVVLIDEYDKPLIDYLDKDNIGQGLEHQRGLKSFYSIIKSSDQHLRFLLITGVSKFSKVGVFSDLNNLRDITLSAPYAALTGITPEELEKHFKEEINLIAQDRDISQEQIRKEIKEWYNGYSFDGKTFLYNPFSLFCFFADRGDFRNYWFATGTPTFLIDILTDREIYSIEAEEVGIASFDAYDITQLQTTPLLFQTGYLTIKAYDRELGLYTLDYPNREVKDSMLQYLLGAYTSSDHGLSTAKVTRMYRSFQANDLPAVRQHINAAFQTIPYQLFIGAKENLYHAVIHILFTYLGLYVRSEVSSLNGRLDSVVETKNGNVYILEFKLDGNAEDALRQIHERGYAEAFVSGGKKVTLIGVNFDSEEKQITGWEVEAL